MTRWLQCPAVLIAFLITLVLYLRSDQRGRIEIAPSDEQRSERLLLRKPASAAGEASATEQKSHPGWLAAESRAPDLTRSTRPSNRAEQPAQPLPGTQLDPTSYSFKEGPWGSSPPADRAFATSDFPSAERRSGATASRTGTRRVYVKHRIVDGDDLRNLAKRYLNDADRSLEIFHANRDVLAQPDLLPLGAELQIPTTLP